MKKIISVFAVLVVTSLYFFPFEPISLPGINTKMIMAGIGLIVLGFQLAKGHRTEINKDMTAIAILAGLVSVIGLAATCYNNTSDYTYSTYIVSMLVWLCAANVVVSFIRQVNGNVSVNTICDYLIALCAIQCLIAVGVDRIPIVKEVVDSIVGSSGFMGKNEHRMYGVGCSLDVAGTRFCAILIMTADRLISIVKDDNKKKLAFLYFGAFIIIAIVGNMIARTTTIGVIIALGYLMIVSAVNRNEIGANVGYLWKWFVVTLVITIIITATLYNLNPAVRANIRFGFEGFFNLVEKGKWEVHSNEILKSMIVFPDNLKTWFIGDGYFENPYDTDPYYTGVKWKGFYQHTDIGYLRFLFYFGVFGLIAFICYFIKVGTTCMKRFAKHRTLFCTVLALGFIIWCKVSTDIFLVFALFLCLRKEEWETNAIKE